MAWTFYWWPHNTKKRWFTTTIGSSDQNMHWCYNLNICAHQITLQLYFSMKNFTFKERLSTITSPFGVMIGTFSTIMSSSDCTIWPSIETKQNTNHTELYFLFSFHITYEPVRSFIATFLLAIVRKWSLWCSFDVIGLRW